MNTFLNNLLRKIAEAKDAWEGIERVLADCSSGRPVHLEELIALKDDAMSTCILEEAVLKNCEDLICRAAEVAKRVDELCSMREHSIDEENVFAIMVLWKEAKTLPLSEKARGNLKRLRALATLLGKCRAILSDAESGVLMSLEEALALKEDTQKALMAWSDWDCFHTIKTELIPIQRYVWRIEVLGSFKSKIPFDRCKHLIEEGKAISGIEGSAEWELLDSALNATIKIRNKLDALGILIEGAMDEMNAVISSSNLNFNAEAFSEENCSLKDAALGAYKACMAEWSRLNNALYLDKKASDIQREERELQLSLTLSDETKATVEVLDIINRASYQLVTVDSILRCAEEHVTGGAVSMLHLDPLFKSIATILSAKPDFLLLKLHQQYFRILIGEVAKWEQRTSSLLPSKLTRTANKADSKTTIADLKKALSEPIPRALKFNSQQRMYLVLQDAEKCVEDFCELLIPPAGSISREADAAIKDPSVNAETRNQLIWDEIGLVYALLERMKLIPIYMPQFKILEWYYELLQWMRSALYTDTSAPGSMSLDEARKVLEDGRSKAVDEPPSYLTEEMRNLGLFQFKLGTWLIHPEISPCISHANSMYKFLLVNLEDADALEKEASDLLNSARRDKKHQNDIARSASHIIMRMEKTLVRPSNTVRRSLEQFSAGSRIDSNVIIRNEEKKLSEKLQPVQKSYDSLKRSRDDISLAQGKKPMITRDSSLRCHRKGCEEEARISSNYCGDTCARLSAGELVSALLEYRSKLDNHLSIIDGSIVGELINKPREGDVRAYSLPIVNMADVLSSSVGGLTRKAYVFSSEDSLIASLKQDDYLAMENVDAEAYNRIMSVADQKKMTGNISLLSSLPSASSLLTIPPITTANGTKSTLTAADLLNYIRLTLEEIFLKSFTRLVDSYPYVSAVLMASEVVEALRIMYSEDSKTLNRKECRSHFLKLSRNLKFAHNDYLVHREITFFRWGITRFVGRTANNGRHECY